ncbi:hypothetical protein XACM_1581 [Xanthomonas euvesicatoria pv. citrumelo F1]|nr:hypothetical protein XACM_1581 [Xanthomonas euvesicatoria pv. citrumelo F1]
MARASYCLDTFVELLDRQSDARNSGAASGTLQL